MEEIEVKHFPNWKYSDDVKTLLDTEHTEMLSDCPSLTDFSYRSWSGTFSEWAL